MNDRWVLPGRALSTLVVLFLLVASAAPKLVGASVAVEPLEALGWSAAQVRAIGAIELACVLLYAIPRTSLLGAILTTGLLGGAIATQLRVGSPLLGETLFGFYLGLALWLGLWLRSATLRSLLPVARKTNEPDGPTEP